MPPASAKPSPASSAPPVPTPRHHYTAPDFITVDGLETAYRREGAGEPVLFLHGAGLTRMWLPFYGAMAKMVDFIAPEHPGFGETSMPAWLRGIPDLVLHYDGFLDALEIERAHVIGFSLGGWIAAEFATTFRARVKSLTLIAPIGLRAEWGDIPDIFQLAPDALMDRLFNDKNKGADVIPDGSSPDEIEHLYGESATFARLAWSPRYNIQLDRRLGRLRCPALVVMAEKDRLAPEAIAQRYVECLPDARTARISGTGHALIVERPDETAACIGNFIRGGDR